MSATTVACLTPPGSGAIAVIDVTGPDAWAITRHVFRPTSSRPLPEAPTECSTWFGHIGEGVGDEVVVAVSSIHPYPTVEIHCHGGRQVVRMLCDLFLREGCVPATPGAGDDIWDLLALAKTLRTAYILLDQANGAFAREMQTIRHLIEAGSVQEARARLAALDRYADLGRHLTEPWRVAIAGAPNVGKSSLLNSLAGYQRSVVAPIPGTTRDIVTATLAFDGWLVEISDTAGLRDSADDIESEGVARALAHIQQVDLCLFVIDVSETLPVLSELDLPGRTVFVLNKVDRPPAWDLSLVPEGVTVSASTGQGLDHLIRRLVEILVPETPPPGAPAPVTQKDRDDLAARSQASVEA